MSGRVLGSVLLVILVCLPPVFGQAPGQGQGGILIDAKGVIRKAKRGKLVGRKKLEAAALANLPADINQPSELRMVSLTRLEAECRTLLEQKKTLPDVVSFLAGLQRIDYVFVLEESKEVVIAGPAEGFARNSQGVMVGAKSGRAVLRLDDLLQAMRSKEPAIGCSFDADTGRLGQVNRYLQSVGAADSVGAAKARYKKMVQMLGLQNVTLFGVEPTSHFAKTLVEADFVMKRISVGLDKSRVKGVKSFLHLKGAGSNSMRRWWFTTNYDSLEHNEDKTMWKLNGQRVQVLSQDEIVDNQGNRSAANQKRQSTEAFAAQFTTHYEALAKAHPALAQLQNVFDLVVAVGLMRQENLYQQADWEPKEFLDPKAIPTDEFNVAKQVPSVSNSLSQGKYQVIGVVGGGVKCEPGRVLRSVKTVVSPRIASVCRSTRTADDSDRWWWDSE